MVDSKPIEELIKDLEEISTQQDELNIPQLLNQLESCGKIMDLLDERAESLLTKMDDILADGQTVRFAALESLHGKPIVEARADVKAAVEVMDYYGSIDTKFYPLGKVGLITSYNYPLLLLVWKLAPALLAENKVIVKPAPQTPESTLFLADFIDSVAPGIVRVVQGGPEAAIDLINNVDIVSFTGSSATGMLVAKQCAANFIPCTLELGGKNAAVICGNYSSAEMVKVAKIVIDGAFANSGQNCCAISRLFIHESIHDQFLLLLKDLIANIIIGDPKNESTEFGHLIDQRAFDKVSRFVEKATDTGLKVWSATNPSGLMYPPTIVFHVPDDHIIAQEEIFGPVLAIMPPFKTLEKVISSVNDSKYGLAAGIFSKSKQDLEYFVDNVEVGMIWQNTWNYCPPDVPFGGIKLSGMGKELGLQSAMAFSHQKSVVSGKL